MKKKILATTLPIIFTIHGPHRPSTSWTALLGEKISRSSGGHWSPHALTHAHTPHAWGHVGSWGHAGAHTVVRRVQGLHWCPKI